MKILKRPEILMTALGLVFVALIICFHIFYTPQPSGIQLTAAQDITEIVTETTAAAAKNQTEETKLSQNTTQPIENAENSGIININTATQAQLETLSGIGPVIAQRIIAYREQNGRFAQIEDIMLVKGIGQAKFEKVKLKITVD